jgi:hypothetical protein
MLLGCAARAGAQAGSIDPARAAKYFEEARTLSAEDGGRLWGVALYGPMFFVNPATGDIAANQADAEGKLTQRGMVWIGKLPPEIAAANTWIEWAGVRWTMLVWPVPIYPEERAALMMHECFHRVQAQLGLGARDTINSHLDTREGRIWLQLEWRALEAALENFDNPVKRVCALTDALLFRKWRRMIFPGAAESEDALEMNEGLAEYTGQRLANPAPAKQRAEAIGTLRRGPNRKSFARSFAYVSGPAYGALLDSAPGSTGAWRKDLKPDTDLGWLVNRAYRVLLGTPTEFAAKMAARAYGSEELMAREAERETQQKTVIAAARSRFVDGPVLLVPVVKNWGYSFDPNRVLSLDENITLYTPMKASDEWGVLECEKGAVLVRENGLIVRAQVPAPAEPGSRPLKIDGCTLDLHPGWIVSPSERPGDYVLKAASE